MMSRRLAIALALLLVLSTIGLIAPIAAQNQFPANAVIRGENVRVRAEPTGNAANNAILQRGDAIVLTGPAEARPDGEFYPVQVPGTGATGWILSLFIDPASITPGATTTVVVAPTAPPPAPPNVQVVVEPTAVPPTAPAQPPVVVVDVPPTPTAAPAPAPAAAPATPPARVDRANRNRNRRQNANATPTPAATAAKVAFSGKGATTTDPQTVEAGKYHVTAAMTVKKATAFSAVLNGPNQFSQTLFNETIDQPQDWTAETDVTIPATGDYTLTVSNANASWKIRLVPS